VRAFLPGLSLALLTLWCGTFPATSWEATVAAHLALIGASLLAMPPWRDPLDLGPAARWLPFALLASLVASALLSPVPRAGRVGLILLPAFLLLPSAVRSCWPDAAARRRGLITVTIVSGLVSSSALVWWWRTQSARPALPLGHHNLLAVWLIAILPIALVSMRYGRAWRYVSLGVGGLMAVTLLATGSFAGAVALAAQGALVAWWWPRSRKWLVSGLVLLAASRWQRVAALLGGLDSSGKARIVYAEAGFRAILERPLLGWGPGSTPWVAARFLEPRPGLNPASQIVADLHSLPLQIAFESGAIGLLLVAAIVAVFLARRRARIAQAVDPALLKASLVSLTGVAVISLSSASLVVLALPLAAGLAAGAALAAQGAPPGDGRISARSVGAVAMVYVAPALLLLAPLDIALFRYDQATTAVSDEQALAKLENAMGLDPTFPLYRARYAWLEAEIHGPSEASSQLAREAAERANGVAAFWLQAGMLAIDSGDSAAAGSLEQAMHLDPLSPFPLFHRMRATPFEPRASHFGSRALAIDPRLRAATFWENHPDLATSAAVSAIPAAERGSGGGLVLLALTMDEEPALSLSLWAFRRSPWPTVLAPIELRIAEPIPQPAPRN